MVGYKLHSLVCHLLFHAVTVCVTLVPSVWTGYSAFDSNTFFYHATCTAVSTISCIFLVSPMMSNAYDL